MSVYQMKDHSSDEDVVENKNNISGSTKNTTLENNTHNNNTETKNENINSEDDYEILSEDHPEYDLSFKIVVVGDPGVGKSCLSVKATKNIFANEYSSTIAFEFFKYNIKINDTIIRLQIWDTCGQEIYRSLVANFYRNASLAILVYSIDK